MRKWLVILLISPMLHACAQYSLLQSGPMNGYSTHRECMIWVQTKAAAEVQILYRDSITEYKSDVHMTSIGNSFIAKIPLKTAPGRSYQYELFINGKKVKLPYSTHFKSQDLWQWRYEPPAFRFVAGSCNYVNEPEVDRPGKLYGSEHFIFENIDTTHPDMMLWMGDNTYLREVDWNTASGIEHRYTHTRSLPEMQALLAHAHHYATWDDHDFGPNNSDRSYWLKNTSTELFKRFWANPHYGAGGGISGTFEWQDVQFFLLDNRSFKTPNNLVSEERELHGKAQLQWLIDAMSTSRAPFKIVVTGGQVLNPVITDWSENYAKYAEEQQWLFDQIKKQNIKGVFFMSGDRHHTELSKMEREGTYPLYELTVSSLTAGAVGNRSLNEKNTFRVADTYFGEHNFAVIDVSGPRTDREMLISIRDVNGTVVWNKTIKARDLQ